MAKFIKLTDPIREFTAAVGVHSREGGGGLFRICTQRLFSRVAVVLIFNELLYPLRGRVRLLWPIRPPHWDYLGQERPMGKRKS